MEETHNQYFSITLFRFVLAISSKNEYAVTNRNQEKFGETI